MVLIDLISIHNSIFSAQLKKWHFPWRWNFILYHHNLARDILLDITWTLILKGSTQMRVLKIMCKVSKHVVVYLNSDISKQTCALYFYSGPSSVASQILECLRTASIMQNFIIIVSSMVLFVVITSTSLARYCTKSSNVHFKYCFQEIQK